MKYIYTLIASILFVACFSNSGHKTPVQKSDNLFFKTEPMVRVRIVHTLDSLTFNFLDTWKLDIPFLSNQPDLNKKDQMILKIKEGKICLSLPGLNILVKTDSLSLIPQFVKNQLKILNVPYGIGWWWAGTEDRLYQGKISVYVSNENKLQVTVSLPLEQYLKGVIPYEIGPDAPLEALKAQAVAARSEAIVALQSNDYRGAHWDLTSDVECQVFSGNLRRSELSDKAVDETRGLILSEQGKPIHAYYASNCGGHSELIQNVWPQREENASYQIAQKDGEQGKDLNLQGEASVKEWILSSPDVYCNPEFNNLLPQWSQRNFRWQRSFSADSLTKIISAGKALGLLKNINVIRRGHSGRAYLVDFEFEKDTLQVAGELNIRQMWQPPLRSSCFFVEKSEDQFIINGAGWGHGVGMCQSGAVARAQQGATFKEILQHYYPGTDLTDIYKFNN